MKSMNLQKQARLALLGTAAVQTMVSVYIITQGLKAMSLVQAMPDDLFKQQMLTQMSFFAFMPIWPLILIIASVMALKESKNDNMKSWIFSITVFLMALTTWSFPFAAFGLYVLLQPEMREKHLSSISQKLEESL